ncbi:YdeI/OmpD-associated family protein [Catenulispora yoronensis]|uniref:YdeI/OmpD-associated family protein n=1 Tax=Catenulispora yoronensis TaxID=450799 RepID=A0ABP5GQD3_9ACTN
MDTLEFADGPAWESWLETHHDDASEAWLRIGKRNSGAPYLSIADALDGALSFGWIDGQRRGLDEVSFLQRYSPRGRRSPWSQRNVDNAEALIAAGRMRPAGLAAIEAAKADGRWQRAYEPQSTAEVPAELVAALAADEAAGAAFAKLGRSEQYLLILPLLKAGTEKSRATAVAKAIDSLKRDE